MTIKFIIDNSKLSKWFYGVKSISVQQLTFYEMLTNIYVERSNSDHNETNINHILMIDRANIIFVLRKKFFEKSLKI